MTIAVLALQGAFAEHEKMIRSLGADCIELRQADDLKKHYDGAFGKPNDVSTATGQRSSRRDGVASAQRPRPGRFV